MSETRKYDFALSFAGEKRSFASALARELRARGGRVFYDADQQEKLSGRDLVQWLSDVYSTQSLYCIVLLSKHRLSYTLYTQAFFAQGWHRVQPSLKSITPDLPRGVKRGGTGLKSIWYFFGMVFLSCPFKY